MMPSNLVAKNANAFPPSSPTEISNEETCRSAHASWPRFISGSIHHRGVAAPHVAQVGRHWLRAQARLRVGDLYSFRRSPTAGLADRATRKLCFPTDHSAFGSPVRGVYHRYLSPRCLRSWLASRLRPISRGSFLGCVERLPRPAGGGLGDPPMRCPDTGLPGNGRLGLCRSRSPGRGRTAGTRALLRKGLIDGRERLAPSGMRHTSSEAVAIEAGREVRTGSATLWWK